MTDQTLTVRADEVQVGDRIGWLGTVTRSEGFPIGELCPIGGLWCIDTGPGVSDPHIYLRPDTLITVTRPDPDAELVEAMARASREAWGAAWPEDEKVRERWRKAAHPETALATPHEYDSPKQIVETLAHAQSHILTEEHVDRLGRLIDAYQQLRPVGADGKHGNLHTDHCCCEKETQR